MATVYKVIFRGDLAPGASLFDVKRQFQSMFKLDDDRLAKLFSGRPVTILRNLEEGKATQWQALLEKAGALVELRPEELTEASPPPVAESPADAPGSAADAEGDAPAGGDEVLIVEPVGADVLRDGERVRPEPVSVSVDHLSVEEEGADVLRPEERRQVPELTLDLSHLHLEKPDE